jgi:hypothetical protein
MPPTPASPDPISFQDLINEFGNPGGGNNDLGSFRVNQTVHGETYRLDRDDNDNNPVPASGAISFADLQNRSLNVVVDINQNSNRVWGRDRWNSNNVIVIGGGRSKKQNGSRIILHVRGTIGSERGTHERGDGGNGNRWSCAFRTGDWGGARTLDVIVGPGGNSGHIRGGGGDGGNGGSSSGNGGEDSDASGENGRDGTSGLGLNHNVRYLKVRSNASIYAGGGGGGGGGGAGGELKNSVERSSGGGGGGGMGIPGGNGGNGGGQGSTSESEDRYATNGGEGSSSEGANGGRGAVNSEGSGRDSSSGGGGGGGGGVNPGEGGDGSEGAVDGSEGKDMDNNNPGNFNERGAGGDGGKGDAEGTGQQEGPGGSAGHHGAAIAKGFFDIENIVGTGRIYGVHNNVTPT